MHSHISRAEVLRYTIAAIVAVLASVYVYFIPATMDPLCAITALLRWTRKPHLERFVTGADLTAARWATDIARIPGRTPQWRASKLKDAAYSMRFATDLEVWQRLDHWNTTEEQLARCHTLGLPLSGDCDDRAVLVAGIAQRLGFAWRIALGPSHAWAEVCVDGKWYAVLANNAPGAAPEIAATADDSSTPEQFVAALINTDGAWAAYMRLSRAYGPDDHEQTSVAGGTISVLVGAVVWLLAIGLLKPSQPRQWLRLGVRPALFSRSSRTQAGKKFGPLHFPS